MYSVTITLNKNPVDEYVLRRERITIGRAIGNDIQLFDATVSQKHARLLVSSDALYIEDLGSTNGTYVNGQRTQRQRLKQGDQAMVGQHTLSFDQLVDESEETDNQAPTPKMKRNTFELVLINSQTRQATSSPPPDSKAINWVAQDENGVWWGFERQPVADAAGWSNFQDTMKLKLKQEPPNPQWRATLHKV